MGESSSVRRALRKLRFGGELELRVRCPHLMERVVGGNVISMFISVNWVDLDSDTECVFLVPFNSFQYGRNDEVSFGNTSYNLGEAYFQ